MISHGVTVNETLLHFLALPFPMINYDSKTKEHRCVIERA